MRVSTTQLTPAQLAESVHHLFNLLPDRWRRKRKLGPAQMLIGLLMLVSPTVRAGYDCMLTRMHALLGKDLGWEEAPSATAFCKARKKMKLQDLYDVFAQANQLPAVQEAREQNKWNGFRLVAIDGSRIILPATKPLIDEFTCPKVTAGDAYNPQTLLVLAFDVRSKQPIAWSSDRYDGSERDGFLNIVDSFGPKDLLIFDRGFPSRRLLIDLCHRQQPFVMRMTTTGRAAFAEVQDLLGSMDAVRHCDLSRPRGGPRGAKPVPGTAAKVSIIRYFVKRKYYVVVTNVPNLTPKEAAEIYHQRWGVETAFRDLKIRFEGEAFHGRTPELIQQELIAMMLHFLLESAVDETSRAWVRDFDKLHHRKRTVLAILVERMMGFFRKLPPDEVMLFAALCYEAQRRNGIRRPDRPSSPRVCKGPYGRWRLKLLAATSNSVQPSGNRRQTAS